MKSLETPRLLLRPFAFSDAPFILRLLNEPSFLEHIGDKGVRTLEDARRYLEDGPLASYARHGHGLMAVVSKETREAIGMCGLLKREHLDHPDLGYAFLPEAWGQGYAFEAARAVLEDAGQDRVLALVSPENGPSIRLLEKLGFSAVAHPAAHADTAVYAWRQAGEASAPTRSA